MHTELRGCPPTPHNTGGFQRGKRAPLLPEGEFGTGHGGAAPGGTRGWQPRAPRWQPRHGDSPGLCGDSPGMVTARAPRWHPWLCGNTPGWRWQPRCRPWPGPPLAAGSPRSPRRPRAGLAPAPRRVITVWFDRSGGWSPIKQRKGPGEGN